MEGLLAKITYSNSNLPPHKTVRSLNKTKMKNELDKILSNPQEVYDEYQRLQDYSKSNLNEDQAELLFLSTWIPFI